MAYSEELAARIRHLLEGRPGVNERKMFGGIGFMVNGHMCCGVDGESLMLRLGNDGTAEALGEPHTSPFDKTGRTIRSMMLVSPEGCRGDDALGTWLDRAVDFARGLPPKEPKS